MIHDHLSRSRPEKILNAFQLNKVICQCRRVSDIGTHADPGQLLNPSTNARAAEQEAMKLLGLIRANKG